VDVTWPAPDLANRDYYAHPRPYRHAARFLRELEGPAAGSAHSAHSAWRSVPEDDHELRAFPELVAVVALVGVILVVLAAWQVGAFTNG
jgi:hypothetical protein